MIVVIVQVVVQVVVVLGVEEEEEATEADATENAVIGQITAPTQTNAQLSVKLLHRVSG